VLRSADHWNGNVTHEYGSFESLFVIILFKEKFYMLRRFPFSRENIGCEAIFLYDIAIGVYLPLAGIIGSLVYKYSERVANALGWGNNILLRPQREAQQNKKEE
jgi:hypothetical protein